jgi:hypothetical protein
MSCVQLNTKQKIILLLPYPDHRMHRLLSLCQQGRDLPWANALLLNAKTLLLLAMTKTKNW